MPGTRLQVKPTLPPETLQRAQERAEALGCSSLSSYIEALIDADAAAPVEGLEERVRRIEQGMAAERSARGVERLGEARGKRWPREAQKK